MEEDLGHINRFEKFTFYNGDCYEGSWSAKKVFFLWIFVHKSIFRKTALGNFQ
jgi:hypothetical protein